MAIYAIMPVNESINRIFTGAISRAAIDRTLKPFGYKVVKRTKRFVYGVEGPGGTRREVPSLDSVIYAVPDRWSDPCPLISDRNYVTHDLIYHPKRPGVVEDDRWTLHVVHLGCFDKDMNMFCERLLKLPHPDALPDELWNHDSYTPLDPVHDHWLPDGVEINRSLVHPESVPGVKLGKIMDKHADGVHSADVKPAFRISKVTGSGRNREHIDYLARLVSWLAPVRV